MEQVQLGVIGGSGLYAMPGLSETSRVKIGTPFGDPSSDIVIGTLGGKRVAFLARHGEGHWIAPSGIPQRANLYALKTLGVRFIISVNACGSLREDYAPGHLVLPDQLFDYTTGRRERTFFESGIVVHPSVADPFDAMLSAQLAASAQETGAIFHPRGTLIVEEGPRFATRAESRIFKSWGCDVIGMTSVPEAFLAREAEIGYAILAHITDYDSWHESEQPVTADQVVATFQHNIRRVEQVLTHAIVHVDASSTSPSHTALDNAIMTAPQRMDPDQIDRLKPLLQRTLNLI